MKKWADLQPDPGWKGVMKVISVLHDIILESGERHFRSPAPESVRQAIIAIHDPKELKRLSDHIPEAQRWEDLLTPSRPSTRRRRKS
jgi:hypothetical protein